ncbi:MAG: hybrid sensor histidine kinase/response regulator, partial [Deltaproteobacteria bacterium]
VVSSSSEGDFVTITVEDSGPGVPVSLRDRIFDPFFTTRLSGTGVGLSLCKKIIIEHGGVIKVDTSQMGGALFKILLPIKRTG